MSSERRRQERRQSERERALLADRLITAEQEERRRLALELHDGPVQWLSGIALMLDAVLHAIEDGRVDEALTILRSTQERQRDAIRSLRSLSFSLEPVVLRDQGLAAALHELVDQLASTHTIAIEARIEGVDDLPEQAQVALYQILREALNQAVGRGPGKVSVAVERDSEGGVQALLEDDGAGERRRGGVQVLEERARLLDGDVTSTTREGGGMTVRVRLPAHAVRS